MSRLVLVFRFHCIEGYTFFFFSFVGPGFHLNRRTLTCWVVQGLLIGHRERWLFSSSLLDSCMHGLRSSVRGELGARSECALPSCICSAQGAASLPLSGGKKSAF